VEPINQWQLFSATGTRSKDTQREWQRTQLYILIEKGTTFSLKRIPLIQVKPVALQTQKQRKNDDKYGYQTRDN
jgi:hypothetical protein